MSEIEVLDLVIFQIGDLRIPVREKELLDKLGVILGNIEALRDAVSKAAESAETGKDLTEEVTDGV